MTVGNDDVPGHPQRRVVDGDLLAARGERTILPPSEVVWSYAVSERGTPIPIARYADEISLAESADRCASEARTT